MTTAFQIDAFQNDAFQGESDSPPVERPIVSGKRRRVEIIYDRKEPEPIVAITPKAKPKRPKVRPERIAALRAAEAEGRAMARAQLLAEAEAEEEEALMLLAA